MTLAASRISGLEVDDEEGLAAGELLKAFPLSLHARQDRARVVAEVNGEAYERLSHPGLDAGGRVSGALSAT